MANSTTTAAAGSGFPAPAALKPSDFDVIFFDCDDCLYFNEWVGPCGCVTVCGVDGR